MAVDQPTCTDLLLRRDAPPFAFHPAIDVEFRRKVEHFLAEVRQRGYDELELAPPVCRMLWERGIAVPPPIFLGLAQQVFLGGVCTGLLFGAGMTLFLGVTALVAGGFGALLMLPFLFCFSAVSFGTLFGAFYLLRTRYLSWRLGFPAWPDLGPPRLDAQTMATRAAAAAPAEDTCPRCGNEPLACRTHLQVWCEKCAHDLEAMGEESWRQLSHARDHSCAVGLAGGESTRDYAHSLPPAEGD